MRIAICDNNYNSIKILKKEIYEYSNQNKLEAAIDSFTTGKELINSNINYNLIFIEYSLPFINGLEIITTLRKSFPHSAVIFMSSNLNVVFDCFKVNPFGFLKKPISSLELTELLNSFFENKHKNHPIWIRDGKNTFCVNTSEIVYLEALNKQCFVHLNENKIKCNKTMARVYDLLPTNYFFRINRAFIINIECIEKYNNDFIYLKNGKTLHISRNYLKEFKEHYQKIYNPIIM